MAEASPGLDLLKELDVVFLGEFQIAAKQVHVSASLDVLSAVEHPGGRAVLERVRDDLFDLLDLFVSEASSLHGGVKTCEGADHVREHMTDAADLSESNAKGAVSFEIGVCDTDKVTQFLLWCSLCHS